MLCQTGEEQSTTVEQSLTPCDHTESDDGDVDDDVDLS